MTLELAGNVSPCRKLALKGIIAALFIALTTSIANAKVLGLDNSVSLSAEDEIHYSGTGRIECSTPKGERGATAWFAGSKFTLVTVAHAFTNSADNTDYPIERCKFILYNNNGYRLDVIPIYSVQSRWMDPKRPERRRDSSHDIAIVRLHRAPNVEIRWPPVVSIDSQSEKVATILGFRGAANGVKVRSSGRFYRMSNEAKSLIRKASTAKNLHVGSYDSAAAQSGSMILDYETYQVIGMHIGFAGYLDNIVREFDLHRHFNYFLSFDQEFAHNLTKIARQVSCQTKTCDF